ncbi:MAG: alkyl hydroperoxide reductase [Sphingomonas bacterium]|uniref:redoxin family protein n=1 Tax=Sphingomonas bacterium TaxID=1895847 RepID=UPI0026057D3D|nr:redoxin family protein [Sphingomonas bacterium]MDB5694945.1 alkyl hydroperoxide reductase [Sphingomonas bacterium]
MRRPLLWIPLLVFLGLLAMVAAGLWKPADRTVRSALVGQRLPGFALPPLLPGRAGTTTAGFAGGPRLLNVFASWCLPCIAEAPQLLRLKDMGVAVDAIAVRDTAPAVADFLRRHGDPYQRIGDDKGGQVQLLLGSSGVPETFVIDASGVILHQHIGDIRAEDVAVLAAMAGVRP